MNTLISAAILMVIPLSTCFAQDGAVAEAEAQNTQKSLSPEALELKTSLQKIQQAIRAKEVKVAAQLTKGFLLTAEDAQDALHADCPSEVKNEILGMHAKMLGLPDDRISQLFKVKDDQKDILVYAATGQQIKDYKEGSTAWKHFPGGTQRLASANVLRLDKTYYEVSFVAPGKERGVKHHLFVKRGDTWKMLGPIWRVVKSKGEEPVPAKKVENANPNNEMEELLKANADLEKENQKLQMTLSAQEAELKKVKAMNAELEAVGKETQMESKAKMMELSGAVKKLEAELEHLRSELEQANKG